MKSLIFGVMVEVIVIFIALILQDGEIFMKATGILGFGALAISAIISRTFVNNKDILGISETKEERISRNDRATTFFLFGIPAIITFFIYAVIKYKSV
jgi:hypothetical protein